MHPEWDEGGGGGGAIYVRQNISYVVEGKTSAMPGEGYSFNVDFTPLFYEGARKANFSSVCPVIEVSFCTNDK